MKILSPLDAAHEVEALVEAGAQELYCGLLPRDWPWLGTSINRRAEPDANLRSFDEVSQCVRRARAHNVPLFLTLNEHYYVEQQYPYILDYVRRALDIGVDAFLIADLALILTLKELNIGAAIHISTGGATFNSSCARYYWNLGASRIVLPRHLTPDEIRDIVENAPGVAFEVFILNSKCHNIDGLCTSHHGLASVVSAREGKKYRNACMIPYEIGLSSPSHRSDGLAKAAPRISRQRQHLCEATHIDARPCGACALFDFRAAGICSVKIVGRGNSLEKKVIDLAFVKSCVDFLDGHSDGHKPDRDQYRRRTESLYQETYQYPCRSIMCYYPTVRPEWNTRFSSPR